jgi:hypothetical protein
MIISLYLFRYLFILRHSFVNRFFLRSALTCIFLLVHRRVIIVVERRVRVVGAAVIHDLS